MTRGRLIWKILPALLSGPTLAALILLLPFGVLTGIYVALDPSMAMYEFTPEEELLIPFALLAALISAANVRLAVVMSRDRNAGRVFEATTDRYAGDPSGAQNVHGHPGKQFAQEFIDFLKAQDGARLEMGEPVGEDYGWGFAIGEKGFSPLWVAVAHAGKPLRDEPAEDYILAVTLEPPLLPWRRLAYKPDFALRDDIERRLIEFLYSRGVSFVTEAEDWVDPEPTSHPAPRF
ncbi:hypothetical protein WOC76_14940 [Methylocystis sp. IM3]|uniref:hypothetical protein n=1 Tax=unclassified Methylocystis TaxID=2625913 RepID=UPI000FA21210|nr:MAG: hypothetical protein EKK29_07260 [Hyphomicrobiales bacterium]